MRPNASTTITAIHTTAATAMKIRRMRLISSDCDACALNADCHPVQELRMQVAATARPDLHDPAILS
jgi:hypothetical protein